MFDLFYRLITGTGINTGLATILTQAAIVVVILVISFVANLILKKVILRFLKKLVEKTKNTWDDVIYKRGVLTKLSHIAPALIIYFMAAIAFPDNEQAVEFIKRLAMAYMIGMIAIAFSSVLTAANDIYNTFEVSRSRPIKGYIQIVKVVIILVSLVLIVTTILDKSPAGILGGLGAMSAVLMLVFKDSILGLVASIQLTANQMVHIGDWIEMPKYGADGDVIEITLQSVKVRNWDKTISTIPIFSLVNDSFKNWRGMQESGGRRIKRSITIDMKSVKFCTPEMIERFKSITILHDYIITKEDEINKYNKEIGADENDVINGRRMTNVGTFRAYLVEYLKRHPKIHDDMTFLVRQLPPGETGLPVEIYVFSNDQAWAHYEAIQADIFDHILAILPVFDLRVYQEPSGWDFYKLSDTADDGIKADSMYRGG